MKYSSIPTAQTVVQHCKARGIRNIIISPGSRNAPLTISFTEDSFFNCFSIIDERCAAFFALGMAQQQREPVVLVCTSGSALLNYYPAIAEAFYSEIPLVVISADRPSYKIDVGDGQTIRQDNVFARHIGYSANLKQDVTHSTNRIERYKPDWLIGESLKQKQSSIQAYNEEQLNKALNIASNTMLPVHINVPFEEPLYDFLKDSTVLPNTLISNDISEIVPENFQVFLDKWRGSERKMVLVGVNYPDTIEQKFLDILGNDQSVIVLKETTSNLHNPNFFPSIDSIIAPIEKSEYVDELFKKLQPDILLTFGGLIISKKAKAFLRDYKPKYHWHVGQGKAYDTFFSLSYHFKMEVNTFFNKLFENRINTSSKYYEFWSSVKNNYIKKRKEYLSQIPFTDLLAFKYIMQSIPDYYQLQLANSSTVRYAQLFDINPKVDVFCNRGTSGIDGSTSTAIGASIYNRTPTLLITGDLSFFYDSNGLWNNYIRPDFRIILINNSGGGIFRILPGKEDTEKFDTFFETTHELNADNLCKMYEFDYLRANDENTLKDALSVFYNYTEKPLLLEIGTPRLLNDKILLGYFDFIS